jgi:AhpD family alkylhydroperoxidase
MSTFTQHTVESAPPESRRPIAEVEKRLGYLPAAVGLLAESPEALGGFLRLSAMVDGCTLDPLARETVIMTVAERNGCQLCLAMHSSRLAALEADPALAQALRSSTQLGDPRLEAVRTFTRRVLDTTGDVGDAALAEFLGQGFSRRNALEVVLAIGTYTLSTYANRLVGAQVDGPLAA